MKSLLHYTQIAFSILPFLDLTLHDAHYSLSEKIHFVESINEQLQSSSWICFLHTASMLNAKNITFYCVLEGMHGQV